MNGFIGLLSLFSLFFEKNMSLQEFELYQKSNSSFENIINTNIQQLSGKQNGITLGYSPLYLTGSDLQGMILKIIIPSTQLSIENLHNYFQGLKEDEKEKILLYWNFNTKKILKYVDKKVCLGYKERLSKLRKDDKINIVLQRDELNLVLGCEVYFHHYNESEIIVPFEKYREFNITQGLKTLENDIWKVGEDYSIINNVNTNKNYMNGYALVFKNKKVVHQLVNGGGLCGISTIFYQNSLKTKNLSIIEHHNHLNYYSMYYGKKIGLDSTIYSENGVVYKDLKVKNNTKGNIIIKTNTKKENGKFKYYIKFFSPFIQKRIVETNNKIYKRNGKKCVSFSYGKDKDKIIKESCYYGIYF